LNLQHSIIRIGNKLRAQVRRKGVKPITKTFTAKAAAVHWAHELLAMPESGSIGSARIEIFG